MSRNAELKRAILDFLKKNLAPNGFRRSDRIFYRKIPIGRQILYVAFLRGQDEINVVLNVSIRHDEIENLYSSLEDVKPNNRRATIGAELGKLSSKETMMWPVAHISDVPSIGNEILFAFWKIGWPFLTEYAVSEKILNVLLDDGPKGNTFCVLSDLRAEKALVAAYVLGKKDNYDSLIDAKLSYLLEKKNPYLKEFLEFVVKFKKLVAA